ncbi:putative platelet-activating factor acetylhydrolase ib alpha subunit [Meira miltonrushii]|uniref:Nuclear distribution protein PAC1 n=1 Tax=Meira miltonrushii TaxID=1280837 RepID=A0A316V444_9BASI|nr:putative platelet-activating factor acetylhydrolase ib alpha subunit [Meira miltonrushii]PWN32290.1 putative platelet-activating factor acetylhydrolase ib alpha subunit [Meira miltonrushii]
MTSSLTDGQRDELHKSMLEYFQRSGYSDCFEALQKESGQEGFVVDPKARYVGLLEKKWTGVVRLQKRVMELEQRNQQLQEELASAPTSRRAATLTDWVPRNPPRHTLSGHRSQVSRATFHPVFSQVVSASDDAMIKVWDWETGDFEKTLKGHTKAVHDVDFDSKGNLLASCSSDMTIKVWDTNDDYKNTKTLFGHDHSVSAVKFMPGDDFLVSAGRDRTIRIWDLKTGFCARTLIGHSDWVRWITPSEDGRLLASCSTDQTARIWDFASGETKVELRGHDHVVETIAFAPITAYAALRDLGGITGINSTTPGQFVATGGRDKLIKIWDAVSGQCLKTLSGHDNWVRGLCWAPNGAFLLSCSDDKTVKVWDLKAGARCSKTIEAHDHFVTGISWARAKTEVGPRPDGVVENGTSGSANKTEVKTVNAVVTTSVDLTVKIWTP